MLTKFLDAMAIFGNTLGGAISISIAQNIFSNTLSKDLPVLAPGVNATGKAPGLAEAVAQKIRRGIHGAVAVVIVDDERIGLVPRIENLLYQILGQQARTGDGHRFVFLARTGVENLHLGIGIPHGREIGRSDLQ